MNYEPSLVIRRFHHRLEPETPIHLDSRGLVFYNLRNEEGWERGFVGMDIDAAVRAGTWIELTGFPPLPPGEAWHNPANLTPEQLGTGYRLLLRSECVAGHLMPADLEMSLNLEWSPSAVSGTILDHRFDNGSTYRTQAPLPNAFPALPSGETWHNPANLTPAQVGVSEGWRLLTASEVAGQREWPNSQCWDPAGRWSNTSDWGAYGLSEGPWGTLRVMLPLPVAATTATFNKPALRRKVGLSIANLIESHPEHPMLEFWLRTKGCPPFPADQVRTPEAISLFVLGSSPPVVAPSPAAAPPPARTRSIFTMELYELEDRDVTRTVTERYRGTTDVEITESLLRSALDRLGYDTTDNVDYDDLFETLEELAKDRADICCDDYQRDVNDGEVSTDNYEIVETGTTTSLEDVRAALADAVESILPTTEEELV